MKTKTFLILFLSLKLMFSVNAQYDRETIERNRMAKARVKTQTLWTYDYVNGKPSSKGYKSTVTKYDTKGNVIEIIDYNQEGKVISSKTYQYDNRNNRINSKMYDEQRKVKYSQEIETDASGKKIKESGFDGNDRYNNAYTYDGSGRLIEIKYTENNAIKERRQFKYSGNKTEILIFNANDVLSGRQENTYNDLGLLLSEIRKNEQGVIVNSKIMQYDNLGNLLQETKKRANDKLDYQKTYQYDKNNRPVKEETTTTEGTVYISHEYQYSASGDLLFESWRRNEKATEASTNKFTYDSNLLYTEKDSYLSTYKNNSLYKYIYEFY